MPVSSRSIAAEPRRLRLVGLQEAARSRAREDPTARRTVALLLGSTAFLVIGGLVMVLSASSVSAYSRYGDSFLFFQRQAAYGAVGVGSAPAHVADAVPRFGSVWRCRSSW
jgi:cell division protein FtsW